MDLIEEMQLEYDLCIKNLQNMREKLIQYLTYYYKSK